MENTTEILRIKDNIKGTQSSKNNLSLSQLLLLVPFAFSGTQSISHLSSVTITNLPDTLSTIEIRTMNSVDEMLADVIYKIHSSLIDNQADIDADCRDVLYSNLWNLYS